MEILQTILETTLNSFDFAFCATVNIATYTIVKCIEEYKKKALSKLIKRIIMLICTICIGIVYYLTDIDVKLLINSAILAPISWSCIFKPICKKFNLGYKQEDDNLCDKV